MRNSFYSSPFHVSILYLVTFRMLMIVRGNKELKRGNVSKREIFSF